MKHDKWWKFVIHPTVRKAISRIKRAANIDANLVAWNDAQGRNKSDVLFALKMGADWASEQNLKMGVVARIRNAALGMFSAARQDESDDAGDIVWGMLESEPPATVKAKEMIDA